MTYPMEPGFGHVGSYQASGIPWLTGNYIAQNTETLYEFPFVTRTVIVSNTGSADARLHFFSSSSNSLVVDNNHYFTISAGASLTYDIRVNKMYISCPSSPGTGVEIAAELTRIDPNRALVLSGSGINS